MKTILGLAFFVLVIIFILGFILPALFTIALAVLVIYLIYRLIKWLTTKQYSESEY